MSERREHRLIMYRPDIDGLRAIAVVIVVIFHIWPTLLPGGFIGVDVFFVISGFLITSIINKEIKSGQFSFGAFYARRMKRILPVFYIMILFSSIIAYFLLLPSDYNMFVKSAISASAYGSNWFYYYLSDYFAVNANEYPLLHTWSLSVEEQYYLFWPMILFLLNRFSKKNNILKMVVIILLFVLSYSFSIYCINNNASFGYYAIFSRCFELMLGSMLSLTVVSDYVLVSDLTKKSRAVFANILSLFGILAIGASSYLISSKSAYPGYIALMPTIGAGLIIYSGHITSYSLLNNLLKTKPLVVMGLISYSVYLWHWPILAFWHYYNPESTISLYTGLWVLLLTFILACASYFFVELSIKHKKYSFKQAIIWFQIIPLGLVICSVSLVFYPNRVEHKLRSETVFLDHKYCFGQITGECTVGDLSDKTPPKVLLFGDSHAGMFAPFWEALGEHYKFKLKTFSIGNCYPLIDINSNLSLDDFDTNKDLCLKQARYIHDNYDKYQLFIINAEWSSDYDVQKSNFSFKHEFEQTISFLVRHHKNVIIMGDIPGYKNKPITTYLRQAMIPQLAMNIPFLLEPKNNLIYNQKIQSIVSRYPSVYYFDTQKILIDEIKTFPYISGFVLYDDETHLSQAGSKILSTKFLTNDSYVSLLEKRLTIWGIIGQVESQ